MCGSGRNGLSSFQTSHPFLAVWGALHLEVQYVYGTNDPCARADEWQLPRVPLVRLLWCGGGRPEAGGVLAPHSEPSSPPSGDSPPEPAWTPAAVESQFGSRGRSWPGHAPWLASKWNLPIECVVLLAPLMCLACIHTAKTDPRKLYEGPEDNSTEVEAKKLRSLSFGGVALLCAVLMSFGFLANFKELIIDGVYRIHLGMPTLRIPAIHSMIALSWLTIGSVQVASGVYGSQSDTHDWRAWHRRIGYVAAVLAILTASSGMVIDAVKNSKDLHLPGAVQGLLIMTNMVSGIAAARRRDFIEHTVYMVMAVLWTGNIGMARPTAWLIRRMFDCPDMMFGNGEVIVVSCASMFLLLLVGYIWGGKKTRHIIVFDFLMLVFVAACDVGNMINHGIPCEGVRHFFGAS